MGAPRAANWNYDGSADDQAVSASKAQLNQEYRPTHLQGRLL